MRLTIRTLIQAAQLALICSAVYASVYLAGLALEAVAR